MSDFLNQWKKEEKEPFKGWDFSHTKDRIHSEDPPWDYSALAIELIKNANSLLDIATGGGEKLAMLAPFPKDSFALEGYHPNVAIARKNLEPLGVEVIEGHESSKHALPFDDHSFDLVFNRHGGLNISEIHRVLKSGGTMLTQQVGGDNWIDLMADFEVEPKWPENNLDARKKQAIDVGFSIKRTDQWSGKFIFDDVGAMVYTLKAVPWTVDNFSVDTHLKYLEKIQKKLEEQGVLEYRASLFLIIAKK